MADEIQRLTSTMPMAVDMWPDVLRDLHKLPITLNWDLSLSDLLLRLWMPRSRPWSDRFAYWIRCDVYDKKKLICVISHPGTGGACDQPAGVSVYLQRMVWNDTYDLAMHNGMFWVDHQWLDNGWLPLTTDQMDSASQNPNKKSGWLSQASDPVPPGDSITCVMKMPPWNPTGEKS